MNVSPVVPSLVSPKFPQAPSANRRLHYLKVSISACLLRPAVKSFALFSHIVKLVSWIPGKIIYYKINGEQAKATAFFNKAYFKTGKVAYAFFSIPSFAIRAIKDFCYNTQLANEFLSTLQSKKSYLKPEQEYEESIQKIHSDLHGEKSFYVTKPKYIYKFTSKSHPSITLVKLSDFLKPDLFAIGIGNPHITSFSLEKENDQTYTNKFEASAFYSKGSCYHQSEQNNIESGVFLLPTNLPPEIFERFHSAIIARKGTRSLTCVNGNCRLLAEAGFSIEGIDLKKVMLPKTFMEHLLFRKVFYTDSHGKKQQVHFDLLNTSSKTLDQYFCDLL